MKRPPWFSAIPFVAVLGCVSFAVPFSATCRAAVVQIELTSGETVRGRYAGVAGTSVQLQVDGESSHRMLAVDQIVSLQVADARESSAGPATNVTLIDGTSIFARDVTADDSAVTLQPQRQAELRLPIGQVQSIRFRPGGPATDPQWLGLVDKPSRSDRMVIRRGNDQLDPIEGVVVGLDAEQLRFELDGDPIEAPRDRLEGVFFRTATDPAASSAVKITTIDGSIFLASRLEPSEATDAVEIVLPGQVRHPIPLERIKRITWASGRILLAQASAASTRMSPYLATNLPADLTSDWFGPAAQGEDLVMVAGGAAEYRVEPGFQTLAGSVGRDKLVTAGGTVIIRLVVDDVVQWEQALAESESKGFRIPVAGARRVRLEALAGDDGDVGDLIRFFKPRLMK
ncbi:NPCBM/NEW2 domain protein [Stieleria maiorica]|uniref:NPCBM/NEW2 domain protein n=1 Tax=Stieleria maiorica TaxID=2795974 RepID=A0A5B9M8M0_9BACT|nr:NPCBM/NEW2 domain-containing protein [Stieleria maiorica]QEF97531.1 NPCBM/NEW2 domain protein [Stieleria maiorica]